MINKLNYVLIKAMLNASYFLGLKFALIEMYKVKESLSPYNTEVGL